MRCLSVEESRSLLASTSLAISEVGHIVLAKAMDRVEARPHGDIGWLGSRLDAVFRWLPPDRGRIFCLRNWGFGALAQPTPFVMAARLGTGEARALSDAPVHHFPSLSWTWDIAEETEEQRWESGFLSGLVTSAMCFSWDGWLVAENCADAIEFWEGNVLFYSPDKARLKDARTMLDGFGFPAKML